MKRLTAVTLVLCGAAAFAETAPRALLLAQAPVAPPAQGGPVTAGGRGQRGTAGRGNDVTLTPNLAPGTCLPGIDVRAPLVGAQSIRNGFDASAPAPAAPYVEATFADGSLRRWRANGTVVVQLPGQAPVTCVPGYAFAQTPAPTMPDLPADSQSKRWLDYQNNALLDLIKSLVNNDLTVLQAISDGERKTAGTNVYSQIVFRTSIVAFYASRRQ